MADKSIGELAVAQQMTDDAKLVVYQGGDTKSIEGMLIKQFARDGVEAYVAGAAKSAKDAAESATVAKTQADRAEQAAVNTPYVGDNGTWMHWDKTAGQYIDSGVTATGPRGPQGIQGGQGPDGPQGVAGTVVAADGFYGFEVSSEGMLTLICADGAQPPDIELAEDGHLYLNLE